MGKGEALSSCKKYLICTSPMGESAQSYVERVLLYSLKRRGEGAKAPLIGRACRKLQL